MDNLRCPKKILVFGFVLIFYPNIAMQNILSYLIL